MYEAEQAVRERMTNATKTYALLLPGEGVIADFTDRMICCPHGVTVSLECLEDVSCHRMLVSLHDQFVMEYGL